MNIILTFTLGLMGMLTTSTGFTPKELDLINGAGTIMRVLTTESPGDIETLRAQSSELSVEVLNSEAYRNLTKLMIATVTHPSQNGVGIAAPQVGINRRVVAVQRFDKEGYPFEVYPNIRIIWKSDNLAKGPEGCLSVPNHRGEVMRSQEITIEYTDMTRLHEGDHRIRETIEGFTAVIFQHEIDHLEGILYIDRL